MGRRAQGWKLRWHEDTWQVRWTTQGKRVERSTGCRDRHDRSSAEKAAAQIYSSRVRKGPGGQQRRRASDSEIIQWVARWVASLATRDITRGRYRVYGGCWCRRWTRVSELVDRAIADYVQHRLREVGGKAVRNETSALRKFLAFLVHRDQLPEMPAVPVLPASTMGKPGGVKRRTRAPDLSPLEVKRFIAALPERSTRGWPVRARAMVAHETSLRPETLHRLSCPHP